MPPMENHVFITEAEWEGRALFGGCGYAGVDGHAGVGGQLSARPYSTAPTESATVAGRTFAGSPPRRQGKPCSFKHIRGEE